MSLSYFGLLGSVLCPGNLEISRGCGRSCHEFVSKRDTRKSVQPQFLGPQDIRLTSPDSFGLEPKLPKSYILMPSLPADSSQYINPKLRSSKASILPLGGRWCPHSSRTEALEDSGIPKPSTELRLQSLGFLEHMN